MFYIKKIFKGLTSNVNKDNNIELAETIFGMLGVGGGISKYEKQAKRIINSCKSRQEILNEVIKFCGRPETPRQRYLLARAYSWSNIEYNDKAIEYLELYLSNDLYEDSFKNNLAYNDYNDRKRWHIARVSLDLGLAYDKARNIDKALEKYYDVLNIIPESQIPYLHIADMYRKKNQLDKAIEILEQARKSKYYVKNEIKDALGNSYKPKQYDNTFIEIIDKYYIDYLNKKNKGYVYKPRNKNKREV